ncbi:MAG: hypothetical protein O2973_13070 [Gemmatimonadetes bacterium]|nr:hypothetical protein [Gemmatimonadota bacterium]
MRSVSAIFLLATAACASGGTSAGGSSPATQTFGIAGSASDRLTISPSTGPNINTVAFAPDMIWRILPAAFDSVSVPVTHVDPASKTIGNSGFKTRLRLGKTPLSRFIECGTTQIGPNADSYDVYMTLLVQVVPDGTGSRLVTTFEASARPISFSQSYSRCSSRGTLESRLLAAITAQLQ